jgi:uracil-DNA glycosylase
MPDLLSWADQGVLLLNATLTVEAHKAGSHQKKGWETFTDAAIKALAERRQNLVFILWGAYAQKKGEFIDRSRHLVIESAHPSPLSARRGFFGSRPFERANEYLAQNSLRTVEW